MYLVPDLEFVERSLRYYEDFFSTAIIRVPHPSLYRMLSHFVFQPPERCRAIEDADFLQPTYRDVQDLLREDLEIPGAYVATGVRAADSPMRRIAVATHGPIQPNNLSFWPIWDWRIADVWKAITSAGAKLARDYQVFGRSFDGLDYRFLGPIKQEFPQITSVFWSGFRSLTLR